MLHHDAHEEKCQLRSHRGSLKRNCRLFDFQGNYFTFYDSLLFTHVEQSEKKKREKKNYCFI